MDNNELLIALRGVVKDVVQEEINPIKQHLESIDNRLDNMDKRIDGIEQRLDNIEENVEIIKTATNELIEWTEKAAVSIQIPFMKTHTAD